MKQICIYILIFSVFLNGCKKDKGLILSGTITINNILILTEGNYFANGFSVPTGKKISFSEPPPDVVTILADKDVNNNVRKIYFSTNNAEDSYYRFGNYSDAVAASLAFKNLTSFATPQCTPLGDSVKANQVWLFKTRTDKYAKLRVISTVAEKRDNKPFAECTFEWVYQPDGSLTFPGK